MNTKEFIISSSSDGLALSALLIQPDTVLKGVIVILHGMAEHKERYIDFMQACATVGYAALIYDHRGHGESVCSKDDYGYFYEEDACYIVEDVKDVIDHVRQVFPSVPVILFAHSMGTLVARLYCKKYDDTIDKLILSGPVVKNQLVTAALFLTKVLRLCFGKHHRSHFIQSLAFGGYDRKFEGTHENRWLSENMHNVMAYNAEEKDGFIFTLNGFKNLFLMVKRTFDGKGWNVKNPNLSILFLAGENDPVIGSVKQLHQTEDDMRKQGYDMIKEKLYPHMRHEILQEEKKDTVIRDILDFIEF